MALEPLFVHSLGAVCDGRGQYVQTTGATRLFAQGAGRTRVVWSAGASGRWSEGPAAPENNILTAEALETRLAPLTLSQAPVPLTRLL